MRYVDFREMIRNELQNNPKGSTWAELKESLKLSYSKPCPTWVKNMEREIGLVRFKGSGRALLWNLNQNLTGSKKVK